MSRDRLEVRRVPRGGLGDRSAGGGGWDGHGLVPAHVAPAPDRGCVGRLEPHRDQLTHHRDKGSALAIVVTLARPDARVRCQGHTLNEGGDVGGGSAQDLEAEGEEGVLLELPELLVLERLERLGVGGRGAALGEEVAVDGPAVGLEDLDGGRDGRVNGNRPLLPAGGVAEADDDVSPRAIANL